VSDQGEQLFEVTATGRRLFAREVRPLVASLFLAGLNPAPFMCTEGGC
jgi:hypothetical protein